MIDALELFAGVIPFIQVADQLSFRRAAEQLGVSTAAVSKAVARLEDRLGVKLLVRSSRTVALTPEGKLFHARGREGWRTCAPRTTSSPTRARGHAATSGSRAR